MDERRLLVIADDFGIGPAVTRGILELASDGIVTGSVMLVNSPYAESGVRDWRLARMPMELGWHPALTIDSPIQPDREVPSLVGADGKFLPLGKMMRRLLLGQVRRSEVEGEFTAQLNRFRELTGNLPTVVNTHHHLQVFDVVGSALRQVLERAGVFPYLRRIREPYSMIWKIPGARAKRLFLNHLGRRQAHRQQLGGFPGGDWLAGITDPPYLDDADFFLRWIRRIPGNVVELTCHPGYLDATVNGRDGTLHDGQLLRRPRELELLRTSVFRETIAQAGFVLTAPSQLMVSRSASATRKVA